MLKNLNPRERTLAFALGVVAFLLANLLFLPRVVAFNRTQHQKQTELLAQVNAAKSWLAKKSYWNERKAWLDQNEPILNAARTDSASQLELLQKNAKRFDLTLTDIQLLQLPATEFYRPVGARISVKGPWPGLVKFIHDLQEPRLFDVIPRFSIKSDDPPPHVQCELEIQRWFHTPQTSTP